MLRLAWQFGEADPDAMLSRIGHGQLTEWLAFVRLEGLDLGAEDRRAGVMVSWMAAAAGQVIDPADVFPRPAGPPGPERVILASDSERRVREVSRSLREQTRALGGKVT